MKEKFIVAQSKFDLIKMTKNLGLNLTRETKRSLNKLREEVSKYPYKKLVSAKYN